MLLRWLASLLVLCSVACADDVNGEGSVALSKAAIIGGSQVAESAAPAYIVRFGDVANPHYCGGVLLSDLWVLTAGHCVDGSQGVPADAVITLGDWRRSTSSGHEQVRAIAQIVLHPSYSPSSGGAYDDLALVRLSSPAVINAYVEPIDALGTTTPTAGSSGSVYGWGRTIVNNPAMSDYLRTATLQVVAQATCASTWATSPINKTITSKQFCAMTASPYRSIDKGDSGGPFVTVSGGVTTLRGITSWALTNASWPGVFVDVRHYTAWINEIVFDSIWLEPIADAWVSSIAPDDNYGSAAALEMKSTSSNVSEGYMMFDLFGITETIVAASLWQTCYRLNTSGTAPVVRLQRLDFLGEFWTEAGLTWNTRYASGMTMANKTIDNGSELVTYEWSSSTLTSTLEEQRGGLIAFRQYLPTAATKFVRCSTRESLMQYQPLLQLRIN